MLVERTLPAARKRLVTIADDARLIDAARLLRAGTDLVVVCDSGGVLAGVITKTDIVGRIGDCQGTGCMVTAASTMTRGVVLCRPGDWLRDAWARMKENGSKNIPVVDQDSRPLGVLNARDALQVLLQEAQDEEALLRDYVMSIGYQ